MTQVVGLLNHGRRLWYRLPASRLAETGMMMQKMTEVAFWCLW